MIVLDTDHLSVLEWEAGATARRLLARLAQITPDEAVTTIINFEEQMRGWLAYLARARTLGLSQDTGTEGRGLDGTVRILHVSCGELSPRTTAERGGTVIADAEDGAKSYQGRNVPYTHRNRERLQGSVRPR